MWCFCFFVIYFLLVDFVLRDPREKDEDTKPELPSHRAE